MKYLKATVELFDLGEEEILTESAGDVSTGCENPGWKHLSKCEDYGQKNGYNHGNKH